MVRYRLYDLLSSKPNVNLARIFSRFRRRQPDVRIKGVLVQVRLAHRSSQAERLGGCREAATAAAETPSHIDITLDA